VQEAAVVSLNSGDLALTPARLEHFHGLLMGAILTIIGLCILGACLDDEMFSRDGATPKNPEVVLDEAAGAGRRQGPRRLVT
jgi:hypothetical protein